MIDLKEQLVELAVSMYLDEPCRICGKNILREDLPELIFVGYSTDNKARSAHKECWDFNPMKNGILPTDWAYI